MIDANNELEAELDETNLAMLEKLVNNYVATLDDKKKNEMYTTDAVFASRELYRFIAWLRERHDKTTD